MGKICWILLGALMITSTLVLADSDAKSDPGQTYFVNNGLTSQYKLTGQYALPGDLYASDVNQYGYRHSYGVAPKRKYGYVAQKQPQLIESAAPVSVPLAAPAPFPTLSDPAPFPPHGPSEVAPVPAPVAHVTPTPRPAFPVVTTPAAISFFHLSQPPRILAPGLKLLPGEQPPLEEVVHQDTIHEVAPHVPSSTVRFPTHPLFSTVGPLVTPQPLAIPSAQPTLETVPQREVLPLDPNIPALIAFGPEAAIATAQPVLATPQPTAAIPARPFFSRFPTHRPAPLGSPQPTLLATPQPQLVPANNFPVANQPLPVSTPLPPMALEQPATPQELGLVGPQEIPQQGFPPQDFSLQDFAPQGVAPQGFAPQGFAPQDFAPQDFAPQDFAPQGFAPQSFAPQGVAPQDLTGEPLPPNFEEPDEIMADGLVDHFESARLPPNLRVLEAVPTNPELHSASLEIRPEVQAAPPPPPPPFGSPVLVQQTVTAAAPSLFPIQELPVIDEPDQPEIRVEPSIPLRPLHSSLTSFPAVPV